MMERQKLRLYAKLNCSGTPGMALTSSSPVCLDSTGISMRTKRSKNSINQSRRAGCSLGTCTVHVLAHRIHDLNNKLKIGNAPADKINPFGYGRRRRSVPEKVMTLRQEGKGLRTAWRSSNSQSRLHKLEALLRRTWAHRAGALRDAATEARWPNDQILQMPQTPAKSSLAHSFPSTGAGRAILSPEVCCRRRKRLREAQKQQQLFIKHREKKNEGRCRWGCWISVPWISLHWSGLASGKSRTSSPGTNGLPSWWTSRWDYSPEFSYVYPVTVSEKSLDFKPIQQGKIHDSRKEYTERKRLF